MALNYDAISSLVRKKRIPELVDNYFADHPLGRVLRDRGAVEPFTDGGNLIVEPLITGGLANGQSYSKYDAISYDQTMPVTAAQYSIKNLVVPIIVSKDEENQVRGDNALTTFMNAKMQIAQLTFEDLFAKQLYGDGTGNSAKDIDGLAAALSTSSTYGGIAVADFSNWAAKIVTGATAGTAEPLAIPRLISVWTQAIKGNDHPDLILAGRKTYSAYWDLTQGIIKSRTSAVQKMADLGFETLEWHGVPVVYDPYADTATATQFADSMTMLNTKYLKLRPTLSGHFETTPWRQADTMIAMKSELLWSGNLTCSNRQRQAQLQDIDGTGY